jgi:uncharacterized protein
MNFLTSRRLSLQTRVSMPDQTKGQARPSAGAAKATLPGEASNATDAGKARNAGSAGKAGDAGSAGNVSSERKRNPAPSTPELTPAVTINVGRHPVLFHVQVASTPEERANGLVGRPSLASDAGVLFVFPRPGMQALNMKDTVIPIDMIFIGADRRIVGIIERAQPLSLTAGRIGVASQFVLQIRGGLAAKNGFRVGQSVEFRAIPGA